MTKKQERIQAIKNALMEMCAPPTQMVDNVELMEYDPEEQINFEWLLKVATQCVYYTGKGQKAALQDAVNRLIKYRQQKYGSKSIWTSYFDMTEDGKSVFDELFKMNDQETHAS